MSRLQGYIGGLDLRNYYGRESEFLTKVIAIRDQLRTAFDLASGQRTRVGGVFKWQGESVNKVMYGFQIRHYDGAGNLTGHELTILFCWFNDNEYVGGLVAAYNATNLANHFRRFDNTVGTFDQSKMFVRYFDKMDLTARYTASATSGTIAVSDPVFVQGSPTITGVVEVVNTASDMRIRAVAGRKFRNADVLEVSSGPNAGNTFTVDTEAEARFLDIGYDNHSTMAMSADGAAIGGFNPYSNPDNFFYDRTTEEPFLGAYLNRQTNSYANEHFEIAYDDAIPSWTLFKTGYNTRTIPSVFLAGAILDPYDVADTEPNAAMLVSMNSDAVNSGQIANIWVNSRYHTFGGGGGLASGMALSYSNAFTIFNEIDGSGEYLKQRMAVYDANEFKGWIKASIGFIVGAYQERVYQRFATADGTFMKFNWDYALAYHDQVGLPFVRWDLEQPFPG